MHSDTHRQRASPSVSDYELILIMHAVCGVCGIGGHVQCVLKCVVEKVSDGGSCAVCGGIGDHVQCVVE